VRPHCGHSKTSICRLLVGQPASFAARQTIGTRQASHVGPCRMQRFTGVSSTIFLSC
jgi:hypothetical protein